MGRKIVVGRYIVMVGILYTYVGVLQPLQHVRALLCVGSAQRGVVSMS